ncbi:hypothetical protein EPUS_01434 [Endocarpon pusillum Z07020]|uniref:Uncharacterized protein n=1 Tax=Endocarpon pusillum (strain Z07020 / HMAS-L-300199) TaxID=1263415 RepID=U1GVL5_ENDPU|nr:uncharacterized protein EPUS_01434 [Endocarpon pusillum Z07020]ERF76101.1 hypothetical protein EPUS_01434 [Endocarpon pusillum Z07020]
MANGSEGPGCLRVTASGQVNRHTRQTKSSSQQASQQAPQHARQHDSRRTPPQAPREAFQQARQQPYRRTDTVSNNKPVPASTKDGPQEPWAGSAKEITLPARGMRQRSSGSAVNPSEAIPREGARRPPIGARGKSGSSSTNSAGEPFGKVTLDIIPESSLSTPLCRPSMRPSTRPSDGAKLQDIAAPNQPPPDTGGVIEASGRACLGSKPHDLTQPPRGPPSATGSSAKPSLGSSPSPGSSLDDRVAGPPFEPDAPAGPAGPWVGFSDVPDATAGRKVRLSIETEFYLATQSNQEHLSNWSEVASILMDDYNRQMGVEHPRIEVSIISALEHGYQGWYIDHDPLCSEHELRENNHIWWRLKMISPAFDIVPHSPWKHHIRAVWKFLCDNYRIANRDGLYTRIRVSLDPKYTLTELKRIASSVIHFETAIEPLQPENTNDPDEARSIWLHSWPFAPFRRSRSASISYIDECFTWPEFRDKINGVAIGEYAWNFWDACPDGLLEFRKAPPCLRPPQVFSWAELTMAFILAAIRYGSPEYLRGCLHNVGSLKDFVGRVDIPGDGPHHLDRIWEGISLNAAREPMMRTDDYTEVDEDELEPELAWRHWVRLREMVEQDAQQCAASVPQVLRNYLNNFSTSA